MEGVRKNLVVGKKNLGGGLIKEIEIGWAKNGGREKKKRFI